MNVSKPVVHHQKFQLLHIMNKEFLETIGKIMTGLLVWTIPNIGHKSASFELSPHTRVNTLRPPPVFLPKIYQSNMKSDTWDLGITTAWSHGLLLFVNHSYNSYITHCSDWILALVLFFANHKSVVLRTWVNKFFNYFEGFSRINRNRLSIRIFEQKKRFLKCNLGNVNWTNFNNQ